MSGWKIEYHGIALELPYAFRFFLQAIVPFYRNHGFAQVKPSTNTRLDLGLALGNLKTPKRLIDTGGFQKKDRITRRIEVKAKSDIDAELKRWMKTAYDLDVP